MAGMPSLFFLSKPSVLISYAVGRQIRIQDTFFSLIESINLGDDLRISYIFHRLILSASSFKKWTSIDTTMDSAFNRYDDGSTEVSSSSLKVVRRKFTQNSRC